MVEITIYGRGGQGGVTLAKLIATAYFQRGQFAQAFGVYAAERSGAPLQAYVRIDSAEITNHNQIRSPDHVIVLDRTLIGPNILAGLKPDGWLILNTSDEPDALKDRFPGCRVACADATGIAVANGLGTRTVPIVNTTMLGMVASALDLPLADAEKALGELKLGGANVAAVKQAYAQTKKAKLAGQRAKPAAAAALGKPAGLLDEGVGGKPKIRTGAWANRRPERHTLTPPCNHACPAGNDVQGFIAAMARKDYTAALATLLETSPLPGVCGRVCPAPCMAACNRQTFDECVNVRELERFAADQGQRPAPKTSKTGKRVAVVGSGPAGLAAAYHLARRGHGVEIFESANELGGVLRTGIPTYRLPRDVLDREIDFILQHGVKAHFGQRAYREDILRWSKEFDAVFVATGLQVMRAVLLGETAATLVWQGIEFLEKARRGEMDVHDMGLVVVGGGNTAIDAARTAKRLGAKRVQLLYRRTKNEMPAIPEEIREAFEEGIELIELAAPLHLARNGAHAVLTCTRMILGEPDKSGRRRPVPATGSDGRFDLGCDRVILALGQSANLSILPAGAEVRNDQVVLDQTGGPIFAGGDFATNEGTVSAAIGSGRRAALRIHATLLDELPDEHVPAPVAGPDQILKAAFAHAPQQHGPEEPPELRSGSFVEVRHGLGALPDAEAARHEAARCFSCGVCNDCNRCVEHCPEGILTHDRSGYKFNFDYCKGCGVCAEECPRGVISMAEL